MREMKIKKVRRKCGVRGCKCTDSYAISLTREMGNSVIICKECLEKALKVICEAEESGTLASSFPTSGVTLRGQRADVGIAPYDKGEATEENPSVGNADTSPDSEGLSKAGEKTATAKKKSGKK